MESNRPAVDCKTAAELAGRLWGVTVTAVSELPSYDDRNFKITTAGSGAGVGTEHEFVMKVHNSRDSRDFIEAQDEAARFLAPHVPVASPLAASDGSFVCMESLPVGDTGTHALHAVRMSQFLRGCTLDKAPQSPQLWAAVGAAFGEMDARLAGFSHPAADRTHSWDLRCAADAIRRHDPALPLDRRRLLDGVLAQYEAEVVPLIPHLPCQVIHGDGNESNILLDDQRPARTPRVTGILDFGDFGHNWRVAEPAILLLYVMLLARPFEAAIHTLEGYLARQPLTATEARVLFPLIQCRLAQSLVMGADSAQKDPANDEYLLATQKPGWRALAVWAGPAGEIVRESLEATCLAQPRD